MAKKKSRSQRARAKARQAAANPVVRGQGAYHQGDYDEAIEAWKQALEDKPSARVNAALAEVHFRRGLTRFYREDQSQAGLSDLDAAAHLVPEDGRYAYHLGLARHRQGHLDAALAAYRQVLDVDPSFVRAAELAILVLLEQDRDPAETDAWTALPPSRQAEFRLLTRLLTGQPPPADPGPATSQEGGLWRALLELRSGSKGARDALLPLAQDTANPAAVRAVAAYALGLDALRRDRQEEALSHWEAARRLGLDTAAFRRNLHRLFYTQAEQAMEEGRWIPAATQAEAALELAPGEGDLTPLTGAAHFHAGHAEAQAGHWPQALGHWERARDLGQDSRELLQDLALAYERAGRFGQAADLWRQVVRRRPRKADAADALTREQVALLWGHVAECYRQAGDVEEAVTTLRNAVKNDPNNSELRLELVDALVADDRWDAASNEIDRILKREPENLGALVRSARIEEGGWYRPRAQAMWRKVLALEPDHLEARERLSELLQWEGERVVRFGEADRALELFYEALTYMPEEPYLYLACADCHFLKDDADAARREMEQAFAQQPDDLDLYHSAVDLCHIQDRPDEAEWVISRAGELAGRLPAGFFLDLAACCSRRNQTEVEGEYVRRAEQAAQGDADGLVTLALYYLDHEDESRAVTYLDQALRLDPEHGAANLHMGMSYAWALEMHEANRHWRQARRTARLTGDRELLEAVKTTSDYFRNVVDMLERGLEPPPPPFDSDLELFDDDDEIW